jgi:hypothetical protein
MNSGFNRRQGRLDFALQFSPSGFIMSDDELEVAVLPPLLASVYIYIL